MSQSLRVVLTIDLAEFCSSPITQLCFLNISEWILMVLCSMPTSMARGNGTPQLTTPGSPTHTWSLGENDRNRNLNNMN